MTTATYVYCVMKRDRLPPLARVPAGMPGGSRPRAVKGPAGTWLIVSDVPLDTYSADEINSTLQDMEWVSARAMAHEAVVEFCARKGDVIPMKLFTIFQNDGRAAAQVGKASDLNAIFRRIGGCAEWSVRVSCVPPGDDEEEAATPPGEQTSRGAESGAAFLARKKTERDAARKAATDARQVVEDVHARLARIARATVRKDGDLPGTPLMLDAAFLVVRTKERAFHRELERLAATAARAGCDVVLSGPWPAYHFVAGR